eukprot:CAMPEP_0197876654 /NCGR_PEP_ID=MMETSP1439-20131203/5570_1 /TAXON_ID=66791 /ORGANISM="Gonyaulax spinifera, Strain CCMP409" /LENGTH=33 /DNA_ID= /DNA_START= /DNA_END= /DNA_ORIENTATION=
MRALLLPFALATSAAAKEGMKPILTTDIVYGTA